MARLPVVQPAACADHRRPGRLPGRAGRHRLVVAARSIPATGPAGRAGFGIRVYRRDAGHAAGRHQAVSVRHLCRPAVPHRIPHPAHRHRRPARHDLHRTATVLPTGLVLDRRTRGGADRDAGLGDVKAVGDHLDGHCGGRRAGAVVADDPLRIRLAGHRRHSGGDAGLQLAGALRRDDHGVVAADARTDLVGPGRARPSGLGRGGRCRRLPGLRGHLVHPVGRLRRVHGGADGAAAGRVAAAIRNQGGGRPAVPACRRRRDRGRHRIHHLAALPAAGGPRPGQRHRQRPALPTRRRRRTDLPHAAVLPAGRDLSAGHAVAGDARAIIGASRRPGHRRAGRLPVVPAVDAGHIGAHHTAVVSPAADAERAAGGGRCVRLRRSGPSPWQTGSRCHSDGRRHRVGRRDRVQPGHPRRVAAGPDHRLHRHRRLRPARRPATARLREVLPSHRCRHPARHRQAPRSDRRVDRRLQLPVVLPLLGLSGVDAALRQPAGTVRQARHTDRQLVGTLHRRRVHRRAGQAALAAADRLPHAPRRT
ncbi:Uncharacterised protein [Mycobacterium tuberculosis]|nr:Uncharacterised protein [Mycobacterium tuberculosis]